MLNVEQANAKAAAINDAFAKIGVGDDTKMPRSKKNTEPTAWEYFVASHLARVAEARKKKAHKAAVKAGIMPDHEDHPMPVGTEALVYAGDVVEISVSVTTPATRLNTDALFDELVTKYGVKQAVMDRLVRTHTVENRAPHKFSSSLVTD